MKTSPDDVTVLLVGGGGIVSPETLVGVAKIVRPPFYSVANAVGAAMAKGKLTIQLVDALLLSTHVANVQLRARLTR